jgi:hypothetical protein
MLVPIVEIEGKDVSRYFISCHAEQTANQTKDPGKYDLTLANINGWAYGAFGTSAAEQLMAGSVSLAPKIRVVVKCRNIQQSCTGSTTTDITLFRGEIQKAECDELYVRIEGSCSEGGMSAAVSKERTWVNGEDIKTIVNDLLDMFEYTGVRHIFPYNNQPPDRTPEISAFLDFDTAMTIVANWAQSIYFFDENDEFWFVPPADLRGFSDLSRIVLRGSQSNSAVGFCTVVRVEGHAVDEVKPNEDGSEIPSQRTVFGYAEAPADILNAYGKIYAPVVRVPNCNQEECQKIAERLLNWYLQYKDVPSVRIVGRAPGLLSKIQYYPFNNNLPPSSCKAGQSSRTLGKIAGLVTRRVIDFSADTGLVTTLDVAQNFMSAGVVDPTGKYSYDTSQPGWDDDPAVVNK